PRHACGGGMPCTAVRADLRRSGAGAAHRSFGDRGRQRMLYPGMGRVMAEPPHIVVVEDEATQRQLLVEYLTRQNFRVTGVDGGTALRRLCERELPALVMLDVGLPGEDGFALARWLREKSGRIGIIMVTAATDTVDRVVGLETGADDYIPKPV